MDAFDSRHRFGAWPYVFGALLGVSIGLLIVSGVLFFKGTQDGSQARVPVDNIANSSSAQTTGASISESRRNAIVVATERVSPAVVSVAALYTRVVRANPFGSGTPNWFWELFEFPEVERNYSSLGSGVVISEDGYILTNEHVIHDADRIEVTLSNGERVAAEIVGSERAYDIALLKVQGEGLPYATLGDSDDVVVGEWAIAIGQPFGQLLYDTQPTVTVGVISALHRDVKESRRSSQIFNDMIQTDAAINPGNSGGPLVNSNGEVIGINTFIFSTGDGGNLGMGFAIPINRGKWVLEEIREYGRVRDMWVGLTVRDLTPELAAGLGMKGRRGLLVREIHEGSPSYKAGLKPGDLIIKVNGVSVMTTQQANHIIFGSRIGDTIVFEIERDGDLRRIEVVLEERPNEI